MKFDKIQALLFTRLQEAAKVLHMDQSHSAVRQQIQSRLAADHRATNPDSDYYGYPSVHDTYGDAESGTVVHSKGGKYTMSKYAKGKDGGYTVSDHKNVKPAYVVVKNDAEEQKESFIYVDGIETPLAAKESAVDADLEELVDLREACFDSNGNGRVKYIAPGHGSTGYYSPEVLKEAVKSGRFDGVQMFIDHATDDEENSRPEGSVRSLAAKGGKASYEEAGAEGPGVYAPVNAYPDTREFLNQRAKDIGVSMRGLGRAVTGQVAGRVNKIAKSIDHIKSVDFVTKAGAGGKLVSLLESFREQKRQPAAEDKAMAKVDIEDTELATLREAAGKVPVLQLAVDRSNDRFNRIEAKDQAVSYFAESGLVPVAQKRLVKAVSSPQFVLPVNKDGVLDVAAFTESLKKLAEDEAAYLKESGAGLSLVKGMGDAATAPTDDETKFAESQKKFEEEMAEITSSLSGVPRKKTA